MSAYVETMAYRGATPWHGLGNKVTGELSLEQWLETAGLDWQIVPTPISVAGADASAESYRAIMRETDGRVYQVASDRYVPTQNAEMVGFFRDFAEAGEMSIETLGSLKHGSVVWALASIGESFELAGNDKVSGYVLLANSHDGTLALSARTTSVRVVCWNTLSFAMDRKQRGERFHMRHTRRFDESAIEAAKDALGLAKSQFSRLHETAQELSEAKVGSGERLLQWVSALTDPAGEAIGKGESSAPVATETAFTDGADILAAALDETEAKRAAAVNRTIAADDLNRAGARILDSILRSPGSNLDSARGTYWGAVNGVTDYVDHCMPTRNGNARVESGWFGAGEKLKERAVSLATQYARAN